MRGLKKKKRGKERKNKHERMKCTHEAHAHTAGLFGEATGWRGTQHAVHLDRLWDAELVCAREPRLER